MAVGLVNFLAGWTLIGWVVALVMACTSHQAVAAQPAQQQLPPAGWYPAPDGSQQFWDGQRWAAPGPQ